MSQHYLAVTEKEMLVPSFSFAVESTEYDDSLPSVFSGSRMTPPCFCNKRLCVQLLLGGKKRGHLPPGGRDGPQTPLQPAHPVQSTEVRGGEPLQQRAALTVRGGNQPMDRQHVSPLFLLRVC